MMHKTRAYPTPADEERIRGIHARDRQHNHGPETDDVFLMLGGLIAGNRTRTCCSAWKVGTLTLLNDATSEDGAQEYAVFRDGVQVESLTCSWMSAKELAHALRCLDAGRGAPTTNHPDGAVIVATSAAGLLAALGCEPSTVSLGCRADDLRIGPDHHGQSCRHCA